MLVERIKELCDKEGTTIKALEKGLGFGNGTIRLWDSSSPSAAKLYLVAFYFGVSMEYLLGKEELSQDQACLSPAALKVAQIVNRFPPESQELVLHRIQSLEQALQALDDVPKSE